MALQIYSTLTRSKAAFETLEPGVVKMYVCGVTVYDDAHVGHALSYLFFDTIRRILIHRGYDVQYVQNFTDIDDKTIARARDEGTTVFETERLGILPADVYPRVSSEMDHIVSFIARLVEAGHAYAAENGDVYFDVTTFPKYGALSRRTLEDAESQEPPSSFKRQASDFALWKASKEGEPAWDSPWGPGRPGWHIECSAMAAQHLGDQIDIHGGPRRSPESRLHATGCTTGSCRSATRRCRSRSATSFRFALFWLSTRPKRFACSSYRVTTGARTR
jgi:cysteinyl-tRNA synthetase